MSVIASASSKLSPTLIIGTGLIGASIGCALSANSVLVHLQDLVTTNALIAAARGAGILERPNPKDVQLVIVASPPATIVEEVKQALDKYPNAAVTDVASVKGRILEELADTPAVERYVGSHPMAGSQLTGPLTAAAELFIDRTWVVTPNKYCQPWVVDRVIELGCLCGSHTLIRSPQEHDRAVAEISHLPQLMSSLTAARLAEAPADDLELAGQGIRDMTRIASSDSELWRQIIEGNRHFVKEQLIGVQKDLAALIENLDDPRSVTELMDRGRIGAKALPSRAGKDWLELVSVRAEIPDEPGAIVDLLEIVEDAGVNVEDLSIEHDPNRKIGYMKIQVGINEADKLRAALRKVSND